MATKLLPSYSHTSAYEFDLVPHNLHENHCLLIPMVGRCLPLRMTVSSYLGTLTLPVFKVIQVVTCQVGFFGPGGSLQFRPHGFINLPVHCHQKRPMDICIHSCSFIALLHILALPNMVMQLLREPSVKSSSMHPILSSIYCYFSSMVKK